MFGIGGNELLIIGVFALIVFGPDKIPELARTASKAIQMFKRAQSDVEHVIKTEIMGPDLLEAISPESASPAAPPTKATEEASSASEIWSSVTELDTEEAEEE